VLGQSSDGLSAVVVGGSAVLHQEVSRIAAGRDGSCLGDGTLNAAPAQCCGDVVSCGVGQDGLDGGESDEQLALAGASLDRSPTPGRP
jgi:hypothetical protein